MDMVGSNSSSKREGGSVEGGHVSIGLPSWSLTLHSIAASFMTGSVFLCLERLLRIAAFVSIAVLMGCQITTGCVLDMAGAGPSEAPL